MSDYYTKGEVVGVQYLRAFAAIGVVFYHAASIATFPKYFGYPAPPSGLHYSAAGVDVFFLISGFIITIVSVDRSFAPRGRLGAFAAKRFGRIVPLMWLAILSYAGLRFLGRGTAEVTPYLRALTLWPSGQLMPNVIWTLRHEAIFYAVFALTVYSTKWARIALPLWVASPLLVAFAGLDQANWYESNSFARIIMAPVNLQFGIGVAVAYVFLNQKVRSHFGGNPAAFLIVGAASLLLLAALVLRHEEPHDTAASALVTGLLAAPLLVLAIVIDCTHDSLRTAGRLLGAASYSIYLFHEHVVSAVLGVARRLAPTAPAIAIVPSVAVIAIVAGCVIHLLIERPLVAAVQPLLGRRKREVAAPAPVA